MGKLVIVSNRLPISVVKKRDTLTFTHSVGGLATGLGSVYKRFESVWVGWPGITLENISDEERRYIEEELKKENMYPVFLSSSEVGYYYSGFCNKTLWPLFHYFYLYMEYHQEYYEYYERVNKKFCEAILEIASEEDFIWVHDYHLLLLPKMLRQSLENVSIGFFLHIPFPSFEVYRLLPKREALLEGLLGADLVGFHTYDYALHFISSVTYLLGYEQHFGEILVENREVKVDAFPMGIDYERFANAYKDGKISKEIARLKKRLEGFKIILSVDRLDYTKGIPQRIEALDKLFEKYPEYIGKVVMIIVATPTRTGVEHYMELKKYVDELVGRVNGKYSTVGWTPIWYLYRSLPFRNLSVLYNVADVALVTPLRDGMNLIAKEFLAAKERSGKGVLALSESAGASKELGEAIIVNPNDVDELTEAIRQALEMPEEEQIERNRIMQERLKRYTVSRWALDFVDELKGMRELQVTATVKRVDFRIMREFMNKFALSSRRLLFLDYDGTLVPFVTRPERAVPDAELRELLKRLSNFSELVIISGRPRDILDRWFGDLDIGLIAEHGVWIKKRGGEWTLTEPLSAEWKEQIKPIMELFVDRTPGSFIEEKEYSLSWHYRKADPNLAAVRARELKNTLLQLVANLNLGVMEGNKVLEVKDVRINKGRAARMWLMEGGWNFIFAAGDDTTDEDLFAVLPDNALSVKVGVRRTRAKYAVRSYMELREILRSFVEVGDGRGVSIYS